MSHHRRRRDRRYIKEPRTWCSGPMIAIFDAAAGGDRKAINDARQVCRGCPMLDACQRQAQDQLAAGVRPRGVQAGVYYPTRAPKTAMAAVA